MNSLGSKTGVIVGLIIFVAGLSASSLNGQDEAKKKIEVVATLPYLGEIVQAIGGDLVNVSTIAAPGVDPHDVRITPSHTALIRRAAMFVENGMGLESWGRRLVESGGNQNLLPGAAGHVYATNGIIPLERPTEAEIQGGGHVHAAGNPHIWLDPLNLIICARNVEAGLARIFYEKRPLLKQNLAKFTARIDEAMFGPKLAKLLGANRLRRLHRSGQLLPMLRSKKFRGELLFDKLGGWLGRAARMSDGKDMPTLITYHRTWSYLEKSFGLKVVATIEEKPGIPASPAHIERITKAAKNAGTRLVVAPPYYARNRIAGVAKRIGGIDRVLPSQPGEAKGADDIFAMFDIILSIVEANAKVKSSS